MIDCCHKWNKTSIQKGVIYFASLLIGWIIRILYFIKYPVQSRDSFFYIKTINQLNSAGYERIGVTGNHTPPLALEMARIPTRIIGIDLTKGAIAINIAIGVLTIYVLIKISQELKANKTTSFAIGLLAATNASLVDYSTKIQRESLFVFLCSMTVLYIIKYLKRGKKKSIIIFSATSTAAVLTRYEGIELICAAISIITLKQIPKKEILKYLSSLVILTSTVVLTFMVIMVCLGLDQGYIGGLKGFIMLSLNKLIHH